MSETKKELDPIFLDISPNTLPLELDTVCMQCLEQGMTTMLLTRIPFFREVMISRFECPHCGFQNSGIQFAGEYPAKGVKFTLHVTSPEDLDRRVVKSCHGVIRIPEIDLEIPGPTQGDSINTIEGVLVKCLHGLKETFPEPTPEMREFLSNLHECCKGNVQFDFIIDDPSGNSYIENPHAPKKDPLIDAEFYQRTPEMNESIGLMSKPMSDTMHMDDDSVERMNSVFSTDQVVNKFETPCPVCSCPGEMRSCSLSIPHFKAIIIMSFSCDSCSYHNGEVIVGGDLSASGRKCILSVKGPQDLNRELLKSELAAVCIPELEIDLVSGTLGGKFTTVEGLVRDILENLSKDNPFVRGDSSFQAAQERFQALLVRLKKMAKGEEPFTLILDDPLSNSYIQRIGEKDESLVNEDYERTYEQNDDLGINDMKTEEFTSPL